MAVVNVPTSPVTYGPKEMIVGYSGNLADVNSSGQLLVSTTAGTPTTLTPAAPAAASVGVATGQVLAANSARKGLVLVNTSTNTISIGLGASAVLNSGITLNPNGGTWVMDAFTFTTGVINAIASGGASNLSVQEYS